MTLAPAAFTTKRILKCTKLYFCVLFYMKIKLVLLGKTGCLTTFETNTDEVTGDRGILLTEGLYVTYWADDGE